jgi:hypothetical protein
MKMRERELLLIAKIGKRHMDSTIVFHSLR